MAVRLVGTGQAYETPLLVGDAIRLIGSLTENEIIEFTDSKQYAYTNRDDLNFNTVTLNGFTITARPSPAVRFTITLNAADPYNVSLMTFTGARLRGNGVGGLYIASKLHIEDMLLINDDPTGAVINNATARLDRCICVAQTGAGQNFRMGGGNPAAWARASTFINGGEGIRVGRTTTEMDQCLVLNCTIGFNDNAIATVYAMNNNVAYDCTTGWQGTFPAAGTSNNASQDGSHPGTAGVTLVGNPFEANFMTPTSGGQLDSAGISIANILTDVANNPFNIGARAIGSNEVTGVIIPPTGIQVLRRRRNYG